MKTLESLTVPSRERWPWRSTRVCLRVLRGICVLLFEPPRMVREVGNGQPPEEIERGVVPGVAGISREERYNCIRWQI